MVPAHALKPHAFAPGSLLVVVAAALLAGCPTTTPSDAAVSDAPAPPAPPMLEIVGRPGGDCTELRFVLALRANGDLAPTDGLTITVLPAAVADAGADAAPMPPPMEQMIANACPGPLDRAAGGSPVCLPGLVQGQPYFVRLHAPFDGGTLSLTSYMTPTCAPADAGTDAAADADAQPPPPDAPVESGIPDAGSSDTGSADSASSDGATAG